MNPEECFVLTRDNVWHILPVRYPSLPFDTTSLLHGVALCGLVIPADPLSITAYTSADPRAGSKVCKDCENNRSSTRTRPSYMDP